MDKDKLNEGIRWSEEGMEAETSVMIEALCRVNNVGRFWAK
jgi:hypothetical protein